jgi:hypothetical protein
MILHIYIYIYISIYVEKNAGGGREGGGLER